MKFSSSLAVFGTASDVGKSLIACAFGRLLSNAGLRVAPFKAQNMSNNSYVAGDGGEIGRAQYVQAIACRVEPSVHHNPVLLKPAADNLSQVIVHGQAVGRSTASDYFRDNARLKQAAYASLQGLQDAHDVVVLEGAGSCAEVNLRAREFVNFPAAHEARARVLLVADIDRGGVFAQVVGSLAVMPEEDRARVAGIVVNKFRGDLRLFDDGVRYLQERTQVPVLGVVPFVYGLQLDSEDAVPLDSLVDPRPEAAESEVLIGVIRLPHISNFTDFDPLARVAGVQVNYLYRAGDWSRYSVVILPGSKSVMADLQWLRSTGLAEQLLRYHRQGGRIVGICGGYHMLGEQLLDETGAESAQTQMAGLGLLRATTRYCEPKVVRRTRAQTLREQIRVEGYEIHLGRTQTRDHEPLLLLDGEAAQPEGVRDDEQRIWASVVHGLFDDAALRHAFLRWVSPEFKPEQREFSSREQLLDREIERFAQHVAQHLDWKRVLEWTRTANAHELGDVVS